MTVLSELSKVAYIGSSTQAMYPIPFEFINSDNIYVSVYTKDNEFVENWTYSNQYIIEDSNVKVLSGFEIDDTKKLLIIRVVDAVQDNRYREGGDFPAKSTETSFDKLTMLIQQHQEVLDRCVKVEVLDNQTPEELLAEVYGKLDSATEVAQDAIAAAEQATIAAENATTAVEAAEKQIEQTQEYVDAAKLSIDDAIRQATDDVKDAAVEAAEGVISDVESDLRNGLQPLVGEAADSAKIARTWATGEDDEVQAIEPDEHSSRGYADIAMAIANAPEDVPVDTSTLMALEIIKGPKGDSGDAEFSGDVQFEGSFNVHGDDNHPVKVTSLAGASASGYQVIDSNGAGESDFEHAATGDRYITRIANKSTATGKTVNVDLYQTTAGKSVLDLSKPDTILAPQLLDIIFPIGSYYLSEESECPLKDWMDNGCSWEIVGTSLVTGGQAAVVGNGMGLGFTNGTELTGMRSATGNVTANYMTTAYGTPVGTITTGGTSFGTNESTIGITTDPTKSGMIADLSTSSITVNIFRRIS